MSSFFANLWNNLKSIGSNLYSNVRNGLTNAYQWINNSIVTPIGEVAKKVDNFLTNARNIPILGRIVSGIQDNPIYGEVKEVLKDVGGIWEDAGKLLNSGVQTLDPIFLKQNQALNTNYQPQRMNGLPVSYFADNQKPNDRVIIPPNQNMNPPRSVL